MSDSAAEQTPWLTVVIPSFRGERWIDAALSSVAAESARGIEILLIDGSPTRATLDIARAYCTQLNLRLFERQDLTSWQAKVNFGVATAAASHACLLPVDDIWLPGRAAAIHAWIAQAPQIGLHLGASIFIDAHGRRLGPWRCPLPSAAELPSDIVRERLLVQNFVAAPAPVWRKDAWLASGGLDESLWYTADWDLWLKLAAQVPVRYHDVPTIGFRIHGGSLTATGSRNAPDFAAQMQLVLDRHLPAFAHELDGARARALGQAARASLLVNCALAGTTSLDHRALAAAAAAILRLGPAGMWRYLRDSRILERLVPRLRARLSGAF